MQTHGKAKLIRFTQDPEGAITLAAKMCYSSLSPGELIERVSAADNANFISRLHSMGHTSVFEHASFTFSIEGVSRALLAQITRHRIASFSVRSQRYVSEAEFGYVIPPAISALGKDQEKKYISQMETMLAWYTEWQEALGGKSETANEDARFVLPNACATNMIVTMNARELMHFFSLRCCNRAQWEIRDIAWQMLKEVVEIAPNVFKFSGPGCLSGACPEGDKCCKKQKEIKERKNALANETAKTKN